MAGAVSPRLRRACWFSGHGSTCGPGSAASHVGSQGMAAAVGPGMPGGDFGSRDMAGAVGPCLPAAILVLVTWGVLWARGCGRPCRFPGHGRSRLPGAVTDHVGSRGMAGALGLVLPWLRSQHLFMVDTSHGGWHPPFLLVGTWRFVGHLAFRLLGTHSLFLWACGVLVAKWFFGGHPGFLLVGTWHLFWLAGDILVGSWHLFWWPPGIFVGTQHFFRWACGIYLATQHLHGHPVFLLVGMWHFGGHLASWWAPSICFPEHMAFWCPSGLFVRTQH